MQHRVRQQAAGRGVPRARRQGTSLPLLQRQRERALLRDGADDVRRRLPFVGERVGAEQVEGPVQRQLDLREGRAEQPAAPHQAGEQREQAGDELARHAGDPEREGQVGAAHHPSVSSHDVDIR